MNRTIHGMVYNAMKLFMEVNPQLFDDCSHDYTEQQNNMEAEKASRKAKWDRLAALADSMKQDGAGHGYGAAAGGYNARTPLGQTDGDPLSQQRMERLQLGDERDRRANAVR